MIRVQEKIFKKGNHRLKIPNGGGLMYILNYRKGSKYFRNYPDRSQFTDSPFMKRLYYLDDKLYFFDATNLKNFKDSQAELIYEIQQLVDELLGKAVVYPEGSKSHFIFSRRAQCLIDWIDKLEAVKAKWPLEKSIKKLKKQKFYLK